MKRLRGKKATRVISYLRAKYIVGDILKTIDLKAFEPYQKKYHDADPRPHGYSKYLDIEPWMVNKLMVVLDLGLDKCKPMRILDIGTGAGYFPFICQYFGHEVVSLDLDIVPMYNDLCQFLKVDRRTWRVEKYQKLPDVGGKFDLVTAFMIKFNNHYQPDLWSKPEWKFFVDDLRTNQMNPNGRIFLSFNQNLDGSFMDDELRAYFTSLQARIWQHEVDIGGPKPSAFLELIDRLTGANRPVAIPDPA